MRNFLMILLYHHLVCELMSNTKMLSKFCYLSKYHLYLYFRHFNHKIWRSWEKLSKVWRCCFQCRGHPLQRKIISQKMCYLCHLRKSADLQHHFQWRRQGNLLRTLLPTKICFSWISGSRLFLMGRRWI